MMGIIVPDHALNNLDESTLGFKDNHELFALWLPHRVNGFSKQNVNAIRDRAEVREYVGRKVLSKLGRFLIQKPFDYTAGIPRSKKSHRPPFQMEVKSFSIGLSPQF